MNENGYILKSKIVNLLSSNEYGFRQKEIDNFLDFVGNDLDKIIYKDYIEKLSQKWYK